MSLLCDYADLGEQGGRQDDLFFVRYYVEDGILVEVQWWRMAAGVWQQLGLSLVITFGFLVSGVPVALVEQVGAGLGYAP